MAGIAGRAWLWTRVAAFACTPFAALLIAVVRPGVALGALCVLGILCAFLLCGDRRDPRNWL